MLLAEFTRLPVNPTLWIKMEKKWSILIDFDGPRTHYSGALTPPQNFIMAER